MLLQRLRLLLRLRLRACARSRDRPIKFFLLILQPLTDVLLALLHVTACLCRRQAVTRKAAVVVWTLVMSGIRQ
jgi:hypothetical protein